MRKIKYIITSIILVIICLIYANVNAEDILYGDTDGDGTVTISDATAIQQYVAGTLDLDYAAQRRADVDRDNKVSNYDAKLIQSYLVDYVTLPVKMGDVNDDGIIDDTDVDIIQQGIANSIQLSRKQKLLADVNGDDAVNIRDVTTIQQFIAGSISHLPNVEGKEIVEAGGTGEDDEAEAEADPTVTPSNDPSTDKEEVVNVPDTLATIPIVISVVSMTLIAVGGAITAIVVLKKQDNKKVDLQ